MIIHSLLTIDSPSQDVKDAVAAIIANANKPVGADAPSEPEKAPEGQAPTGGLYIGKQPALDDDKAVYTPFEAWGKDIKLGSWNGDNVSINSDQGKKDTSYVAFAGLVPITHTNVINFLDGSYNKYVKAVEGIQVVLKDHQAYTAGFYGVGPTGLTDEYVDDADRLILAEGEKIIKIESKALTPTFDTGLNDPDRIQEGRNRVIGLRLTTDKGNVWTVNGDYDNIKDANVVTEDAPYDGWFLKGFYGAQTRSFLSRVGPIWGHLV